jgi:hypothetical protein
MNMAAFCAAGGRQTSEKASRVARLSQMVKSAQLSGTRIFPLFLIVFLRFLVEIRWARREKHCELSF